MVSSFVTILYIVFTSSRSQKATIKKEWDVPIPSFTGIASGEKSTVVILATDDPYLIHSPMKP
jgi:hypothetical protein